MADGKDIRLLIPDRHKPSSRVRVLNLLPVLEAEGLRAQATELPDGLFARLRLYRSLAGADAVVLQRKLMGPLELFMLRRSVRRLLFDFDDAIFLRDAQPSRDRPQWGSYSRSRKFIFTARRCDMVLAGNAYLAEETKTRAGAFVPVELLPSAVPVTGMPVRDFSIANPLPVVGWTGSRGNLRYLGELSSALASVARKQPFVLRVICDASLNLTSVQVENIPWRLDTQEAEMARFDIGLMPLPNTPWTRGKCSYKLLQYMAAGVPFVASAVGMNVEVADGGAAGLLAEDSLEFGNCLNRLLGDAALRERLGRRGRELAQERYSLEAVGRRLAVILRGVIAGGKAEKEEARVVDGDGEEESGQS